MIDYAVDVAYTDRIFDTVELGCTDREEAEFIAMNMVRDMNPDASNVEVLGVREVG